MLEYLISSYCVLRLRANSYYWWKLRIVFCIVVSEKEEMQGVENETVPIAKPFLVTRKMEEGLVNCAWPGRTQILTRGRVTYFLDGAHTEDSIAYCIKWFKSSSSVLQTYEILNKKGLILSMSGKDSPFSYFPTLIHPLKKTRKIGTKLL